MKKSSFFEVNMLSGPIVKNLFLFAFPLMLSNLLQSLYNMADMIVLGRFAGKAALAAVGTTGSTYSLIVNVFLGVSMGAGILIAQQMGAKDAKAVNRTVHTSAAVVIILGVFVAVIGVIFSPLMLEMIDTPEDIIGSAVLYLRYLFIGMPATVASTFGAAILRSAGNSRHPMYYLGMSGALNVVLNLFFVLGFNMSVEGVALATIISQYLSAFLMWHHLYKVGECYYFSFKEIKIHKAELVKMIKIGIPSGIQMSMFSISNLLVQSAVNSFGTDFVAANTTSVNVENITLVTITAITQSVMVFSGQNFGAKNIKRLKEIFLKGMAVTAVWSLCVGGLCLLFGETLMNIYTSEQHIIEIGLRRVAVICPFYFVCGFYECTLGVVRSMGYSLAPMIASVVGICGFRILYVETVFRKITTFEALLSVYPISWLFTVIILIVLFVIFYNKEKKKLLS